MTALQVLRNDSAGHAEIFVGSIRHADSGVANKILQGSRQYWPARIPLNPCQDASDRAQNACDPPGSFPSGISSQAVPSTVGGTNGRKYFSRRSISFFVSVAMVAAASQSSSPCGASCSPAFMSSRAKEG